MPEANLGDQAQLLAQVALRRYRDVEVLCEKSHCYGIFTKPGDPERYVMRMRDKLGEDGLFFADGVICTTPPHGISAADRLAIVMKEFKRQFTSFRAIHIVPASLVSRVRIIYSGKADKDNKRSNRAKDDMMMALLFGYFYYTQYTSPHALVSKRDSYSMLRMETFGGTRLEGGTEAVQPDTRKRARGIDDTRDDGRGRRRRAGE